jgi:pyruvate-formate lyase-activating enzyme
MGADPACNTINAQRTHVYHITYAEQYRIASLFFWGCNLRCRICLLKKEAYDCHLPENRLKIYDPSYQSKSPETFLTLAELCKLLEPLELKKVFLMGAEPLCDPLLPEILYYLKETRACYISLLTNGKEQIPHALLDEVIFSIKAVTSFLHRTYTGEDNAEILSHFKELAEKKSVHLHAETVFIPDYADEKEVMKIAEFIASIDRNIPFRIDAYLPVEGLPWRAPEPSEIEALMERVKEVVPNTTCFYGDAGKTPLVYEVKAIF